MESPKIIESVFWNNSEKKWDKKKIVVEEYHGFTECRRCQKPMSHNVKAEGKFQVVYVRCACSKP